MKSQVNVAWIAGASFLAVIGVLSFSLAYQVQSVVRGLHERSTIEAINEMEFVKKAIPQAAIYSTNQAGYETLKYGGYSSSGCDPQKFDDLPYWRTFEKTCAPDDIKSPIENRMKELFTEYLSEIQAQVKKINIRIPTYKIALTVSENNIEISALADDELEFESEKQKISDKSDVQKEIKLPLKRLIDFGIAEFIDKDPFPSEIEDAHQAMSGVTVQNRVEANQNSVNLAFVNNNLNDGELTDKNNKNCKATEYKICIDPTSTPDFTYVYPPKLNLLPTNCEPEFNTKVDTNIDSLDSRITTSPYVDSSIKPKLITTSVDTDDETLCTTVNQANSDSCDCINWACTGGTPVVFGATNPTLQLPSMTVVDSTQQCSACVSIDASDVCTQFADMECPSGYVERDVDGDGAIERNECVRLYAKICPAGYQFEAGSQCYRERILGCTSPAVPCNYFQVSCSTNSFCGTTYTCPTDHPNEWQGGCYLVETCGDGERCDSVSGCISDPGNTAREVCWYDRVSAIPISSCASCTGGFYNCDYAMGCESTVPCDPCLSGPADKVCPSGTTLYNGECRGETISKVCPSYAPEEFGSSERCYQISQNPVCTLRKTLYTKTCDYNYQASVTALVDLTDNEGSYQNKYPVYDPIEKKTDLRNLELQFYMLSKN